MNSNTNRRSFIKSALLATGGVLLIPNFISCNNDDDVSAAIIPDNLSNENFNQGVASFDPQSNQVIIWTRYTTTKSSATLTWQLATNADFTNVIRSGAITTDSSRDFTAAVEVQNLDPGLTLFYRFIHIADATVSPIGETFTPATTIDELKLAVVSCSNLPAGYFNVYNAIAASDADVVVHLGDYIYEYALGEYGTVDGFTSSAGRTPSPNAEIITLDQYRQRYRQYREDADLMELHRKKPFVTVWDDHEITNDAYTDGAENHDDSEGSFQTRKQDALQAYSEYLPATTNDISIIYRTLSFGNLADLIMLDTRLIGRNRQLSYTNPDYYDAQGDFDAAAFQTDLLDPARTILGTTQRDWLLSEVSGSSANWQIIGQQVLMTSLALPAELIVLLGAAGDSPTLEDLIAIQTSLGQLVEIKARILAGDPTVTAEEEARLNTVLPFNLDAWEGYPVERETILASFANKNVVVLAGDTHNAWEGNLNTQDGTTVAREIATASVSSPGIGEILGGDPASIVEFEQALTFLINDLTYTNLANRGYLLVNITTAAVSYDYNFVDTIFSPSFSTSTGYSGSV